MPSTQSSRKVSSPDELPAVNARVTYLAAGDGPVQVRVYPPGSGLATVRPPAVQREVSIRDARPIADAAAARRAWVRVAFASDRSSPTSTTMPQCARATTRRCEAAMRAMTGALAVIVFDHNVRSAARAARGEARRAAAGRSGAQRLHRAVRARSASWRYSMRPGAPTSRDRHFAFVNLWRPIVGPVWDNPLAVCEARSVAPEDLVDTDIQHFGEDDLTTPRHSGQIYSVRYNPAHRWFYLSADAAR